MALRTGTRLGPYEIVSPLGSGGMGEVYRAHDTRLDRNVAIKLLPSELQGNAELRQRLEREARVISTFNHPNICTLYDIGHQDDMNFLVMELIDGESLSDRLVRGPMPPQQVLKLGIELADALDRAHHNGIIHRDLKPGNIMLTKSGAKLMDFGLAKPLAVASAARATFVATAESKPLTAEGVIVGTFPYMAPEQVEGHETDARSDIFSLGTVLYEAAAGKRAFQGKTQASIIAAILASDPTPLTTVEPLTPPALEHVIRSCMAKDPEDRIQTAHDLKLQLQWIAAASTSTMARSPRVLRLSRKTERYVMLAAIVLLIVFAALVGSVHFREIPEAKPVIRFSVVPSTNSIFNYAPANAAALSPDGRYLAYVANQPDGQSRIEVRALDSVQSRTIAGTEEAFSPFWSADSQNIGFFSQRQLKRVTVSGGPVQTLCAVVDGRGGSWNEEGTIIFSGGLRGVIYKVAASGGQPVPVTQLDKEVHEIGHVWPRFLPDGRHFLYLALAQTDKERAVFTGSLDSFGRKKLFPENSSVEFAPPNYVLYAKGSALMAQRVDMKTFTPLGDPILIAQPVYHADITGRASISVSATGILAYRTGGTNTQLAWYDLAGKPLGQLGSPGLYSPGGMSISPDGSRVAVSRRESASSSSADIWVFDVVRQVLTRVTNNPVGNSADRPIWMPDGKSILFVVSQPSASEIRRVSPSGSEQVTLAKLDGALSDVSRDGKLALLHRWSSDTTYDIWLVPLDGSDTKPLLQTNSFEMAAKFSPDMKAIAYTSDESGRLEIYLRSFPEGSDKVLVSTKGGSSPRFSKDGRYLYYLSADQKMMAAAIHTQPLQADLPQTLFNLPFGTLAYAVAKDGRFLLLTSTESQQSSPVNVVLNWQTELKK